MSVPVKNRKDNVMAYIKKGSDLYMRTITIFSKIEKTYPEMIGNLKDLSNQYFINAYMADKTYIEKISTREKFNIRQKYLDVAIASIYGYRAELNLLYSIMRRGDSRLGNKKELEDKFRKTADIVNEITRLILGVKDSDKNRWEQWHPSRKQQNKNKDKADSFVNKNRKSTKDEISDEQLHQIAESLRLLQESKNSE